MDDELALWSLIKGLFFLLMFPFRMLFLFIDMAVGSAKSRRSTAQHEEWMKNHEEQEQARLAAPFKSNTTVMEREAQERIKIASFPSAEDYADAFLEHVGKEAVKRGYKALPGATVDIPVFSSIFDLYTDEGLSTPLLRRIITDEIDEGRYRDELLAHGRKAENPAQTIKLMTRTFTDLYFTVASALPPFALTSGNGEEEHKDVPTISILDAVSDPGKLVSNLSIPLFREDVVNAQLFSRCRKQLEQNGDNATGKALLPDEYKGTGREIAQAYLRNTPLMRIFDAKVPFEIPMSRRFEHTAIVAGSGHGKTQLLQSIIAHDLELEDPPAMVVLDSTGAMVNLIQRLAVFNDRLRDRIVIIDPEDDPVPALNMFDVSNPRLQTYGRAVREEVETEVIALFNYVFSSLATELTGQQSSAFSYVVRLLLSMPGSTLHTLRELLEDTQESKAKFAPHIARLDPTAQSFFQNHFYQNGFRSTRASIARRLYGLIQVPAFDRMFSTVNKVDLFTELQRGSIILVNTSSRLLKDEASPLFGRYMIARTLAAIFERAALPPQERRAAFLIVDEAAPYFDDTFDSMLTRVRQFKLGVVIAFQHMEQTSQKLRSAIASNTAIKYAGGLGYTDSTWLAREMRTTQEFIQAQRRDPHEPPKYTQFACYVRNYADNAVSLTVPIGTLEAMPKMSEHEHVLLRARNRTNVAGPNVSAADEPMPLTSPIYEPLPLTTPITDATPQTPPPPPRAPDGAPEGATEW